jgi:hypothetical protein
LFAPSAWPEERTAGTPSGPAAEAFKPSDRLVIGPTAEAFKASNVSRATLHSCGSSADTLAGVMGNEVAAHRKLLSPRW